MLYPGTTIFLLEDNPLYQTLLLKQLESMSPDLRIFSKGESFLDALSAPPDLAILDYDLEGNMNGYDVLKRLKALPYNLPVIFFSANLELPVTTSILKLGVRAYIEKNIFAFPRLKDCINQVLQKRATPAVI
jgi:CheY-like chemotaxis protein